MTEHEQTTIDGGTELVQGAGPFGSLVDFNLSIPPIEARMVNASALEDYEIWFFSSSLIFSAAVGFIVAYVQSLGTKTHDNTSLVVSIVFALFFVLSLARVLTLRKRLVRESKTYPMRAVGVSPAGSTPQVAPPEADPVPASSPPTESA